MPPPISNLVLVYDAPANGLSDGAKPLDVSTWVTRLTQRLVTHLTAPTRRGRLYDVDMRLRPSGRQGPLATKFSAFAAYQKTTAATWEHLALTRARVVAGDASLARRIEAAIVEALGTPGPSLLSDRRGHAHADGTRAAALGPVGLQARAGRPRRRRVRGADAFPHSPRPARPRAANRAGARSGPRPLPAGRRGCLRFAGRRADQIVKLALPAGTTPDEAGRGFKARLAQACGCAGWAALKPALAEARTTLRAAFETLVGAQAAGEP